MNIILITIAFLVLAVFEALPLIREGEWRELTAAGSILFLGVTFSILLALGVQLPSPNLVVGFVSDMVLGLLRIVF